MLSESVGLAFKGVKRGKLRDKWCESKRRCARSLINY